MLKRISAESSLIDEGEWHSLESAEKGMTDPIRHYKRSAALTPLLDPENESLISTAMVESRSKWQSIIMTSGVVQRHMIDLYRETSETCAKAHIKERLSADIKMLRKQRKVIQHILPELTELENVLITLSTEAAQAFTRDQTISQEHNRELLNTRSLITDILMKVSLPPAWVENLYRPLRDSATAISAEAPADIYHFIQNNGETPDAFLQHMREAEGHYEQWQKNRDHLIRANLRLVINIAKEYRNHGRDDDDLIQDGNDGLMHGIDKFDPETGYRISTYVSPWIHQRIKYGIANNDSTVRIPPHIRNIAYNIRHREQRNGGMKKIYDENDIEATATALGESFYKVESAVVAMRQRILSMNISSARYGDDSGELSGRIPDYREDSVENAVTKKLDTAELRHAIYAALRSLTVRERAIINQRFGLGIIEMYTEYGIQFGLDENSYENVKSQEETVLPTSESDDTPKKVTRKRINQIEKATREKLAHVAHPLRQKLGRIAQEYGIITQYDLLPSERQNISELTADIDSNHPALGMSLAEIGLSRKTINALEKEGVYFVRDVVRCTDSLLKNHWHLMKNLIKEIDDALLAFGLWRRGTTPPATVNPHAKEAS